MLVKFEVTHGQLQLPDLSQSGSAKGSTNKVTMAHDIPFLMHICFAYTVLINSCLVIQILTTLA